MLCLFIGSLFPVKADFGIALSVSYSCHCKIHTMNRELMMEEHKKEIEADLDMAIQKGRRCGMEDSELSELFHLLLEE